MIAVFAIACAVVAGVCAAGVGFAVTDRRLEREFRTEAPSEYRDDLRVPDDGEDEWTEPLRGGARTKAARRLAAELHTRRLMLPNRASAARRKLAVALDRSRPPARLPRAVALITRLTARRQAVSPGSRQPAPSPTEHPATRCAEKGDEIA